MASTLFHIRSESLPSKPHPLISELDEHICRLRDCEASASTSTSSTSIVHRLSGLQDLQEYVDKLLLLPQTQHLLSQEQNKKWVEELLDGSLGILDVCNTAKNALLQTKEYTLEIESALRRRQLGPIDYEVRKYLTSRKMAKKAIQKAFHKLKTASHKKSSIDIQSSNCEISSLVRILKEVEDVTLGVLKSFMSFVSGTNSQSKPNKWSLVSKIMLRKRIACDHNINGEELSDANEFAMADSALESLVLGSKSSADNNDNNMNYIIAMDTVQNHLKDLELAIQHLEEATHTLFRRLIKTRVSLLNIFN